MLSPAVTCRVSVEPCRLPTRPPTNSIKPVKPSKASKPPATPQWLLPHTPGERTVPVRRVPGVLPVAAIVPIPGNRHHALLLRSFPGVKGETHICSSVFECRTQHPPGTRLRRPSDRGYAAKSCGQGDRPTPRDGRGKAVVAHHISDIA